jgi:hypothetical protein
MSIGYCPYTESVIAASRHASVTAPNIIAVPPRGRA